MPTRRHEPRLQSFSRAIALGLAGVLALVLGPAAAAQEATPPAEALIDVTLTDVDGNEVGTASFTQVEGLDAVRITVEVSGLEPGDHGIHIHEIGTCDPAAGDGPFSTAGGHYNPAGASHGPGPMMAGTPDATPAGDGPRGHAGDLGNITVGEDGTGTLNITSDRISLLPDAENTLADPDGSALVVHEGPDDLQTDPSGDSGGRIACGVIVAGTDAAPVASPAS